jgi:hypothetical protein
VEDAGRAHHTEVAALKHHLSMALQALHHKVDQHAVSAPVPVPAPTSTSTAAASATCETGTGATE